MKGRGLAVFNSFYLSIFLTMSFVIVPLLVIGWLKSYLSGWGKKKKNFLNPERNKTSHLVAGNLNVIFDYLLENS